MQTVPLNGNTPLLHLQVSHNTNTNTIKTNTTHRHTCTEHSTASSRQTLPPSPPMNTLPPSLPRSLLHIAHQSSLFKTNPPSTSSTEHTTTPLPSISSPPHNTTQPLSSISTSSPPRHTTPLLPFISTSSTENITVPPHCPLLSSPSQNTKSLFPPSPLLSSTKHKTPPSFHLHLLSCPPATHLRGTPFWLFLSMMN
ncbi:hypothetical protein E2C01_079879 [Portunus trituberculatus]|uniref:Uncharacterized protein n=1 Tax=Portunus trituberculatus TaxID=210409 RepID=A0A5B7IKP4_PORTR|nr:hypothetical protein [Portunus trituberculatus]